MEKPRKHLFLHSSVLFKHLKYMLYRWINTTIYGVVSLCVCGVMLFYKRNRLQKIKNGF